MIKVLFVGSRSDPIGNKGSFCKIKTSMIEFVQPSEYNIKPTPLRCSMTIISNLPFVLSGSETSEVELALYIFVIIITIVMWAIRIIATNWYLGKCPFWGTPFAPHFTPSLKPLPYPFPSSEPLRLLIRHTLPLF